MQLHFKAESIEALKRAKCKSPFFKDPERDGYGGSTEVGHILESDFPIIRKVLGSEPHCTLIENRRIIFKLNALEMFDKKGVVKKLELLPTAIRRQLKDIPNHWLFVYDNIFKASLPWLVTGAEYSPARQTQSGYMPANVSISLEASVRGSNDDKNIVIYQADMGGSIAEILDNHGALVETPELVLDYEKSIEKYHEHCRKMGDQYLGVGSAKDGYKEHSLEMDGVSAKLVMDDGEERENADDSGYCETPFWGEDEEGDGTSVKLPVHPVVNMFDLRTHEYVVAHVDSVEPYPYDTSLGKKLVLPADHKKLIDALTLSAIERMDDIVKGKATGVIILSKGLPGTGKTLSAEVYSEVAKRPLYMVQCSQLGMDIEEVEGELQKVLRRATRWRAILLIDEADVYIHERGEDLLQNAIVGVFLRLLEYYAGILFMTTNRGTAIDDAILSRCTAVIEYKVPEGSDRNALWRIIADQYGVSDLDIEGAIRAFPSVSGRSIRQMVRLAKLMAVRSGTKVDVQSLKWAARFQEISGDKS